MSLKEWFAEWFDSPYYHLLYQNRDEREARFWIDNLCNYLKIEPQHLILDLACGKGRHAIYLNQKGYQVVGIDLSDSSIRYARQFENERLHFYRQDMRDRFHHQPFDFILNLFTSFGYFETEADHLQALQNVAQNLKKGGKLVLDFFNTPQIIAQLVPEAEIQRGDITFKIRKRLENQYIIKSIDFQTQGRDFHFEERVRAISKGEFESYFRRAGLKVLEVLGSYDLKPYRENESERMIFVAEKE
jgi:SAM-dependent methyltransferase